MSGRGLVHVPDMCRVGLAAGSASDYRPKGTGKSNYTSLIVEDMRRRRSRVWGDATAMSPESCRETGQTNTRKHHVAFEGDIYKMATSSRY